MRRGAAWPAGRPSSFLVVREAVSRWQVAPPPSRHGCQAPRRCPQEYGWAFHRAAAGRSGPGGADAGAVPSSPCPRPRPASGVQCPVRASSVHACSSTRPLSSVRCGHLSVQASGVQCGRPVSIRSRVRCVGPEGRGGRRWGRQSHAGMAGVGVVARRAHDRLVVCPSRKLAIEAGAGRAGQRRRRLGLGRRRRRWLSSG
jgi:hypothetical protein